jgi:hypothetical protein
MSPWIIAAAPLVFLGLGFVAIRRSWPLPATFLLLSLHSLPFWFFLFLVSVFAHRARYQRPLVAAMVVASLGHLVLLMAKDRIESWAGQIETQSNKSPRFRYPFTAAMGIVFFVSFGLAPLQLSTAVRLKGFLAFGLTALAIVTACFLFERSDHRQKAKSGNP